MVINMDNDLNGIEYNAKNLFNKIMLIVFILFYLLLLSVINGVLDILIATLVFLPIFIYYILKIKNLSFYIDKEKIVYQNIFGKKHTYSINDIQKCKYYSGFESDSIIAIKLKNSKIIRLFEVNNNFNLVKFFLKNNNLL